MTENSLILFTEASKMLAEADTIQKAKELKDLALTAQDWAKRKNKGEEAIQYARSYAFEAERRMGELLKGTERQKPGQYQRLSSEPLPPTLSDLHLTKRESSDAQFLADLPEEVFEEVKANKKKVSVLKREFKCKEDGEAIKNKTFPIIEGKFKTILIDPPWDYELNFDGRAKPEYLTMTMEKLKALKIDQYAEKNCHLYIWSTNNNIPLALELGKEWDFAYKTIITWIKPSIGMGSYFRNSTEQLLFFVKGKLSTRTSNIPTHFEAPRGKHSEKPQISYQIIEQSSYPYFLEFFGRKEREGWIVHGNY